MVEDGERTAKIDDADDEEERGRERYIRVKRWNGEGGTKGYSRVGEGGGG